MTYKYGTLFYFINLHPNIFDKLIHSKPLRWMELFYTKHKESLLYLFFGGLTFLISILSFALLMDMLFLDALVSDVISWIIAVLFAFFTNKILVFQAPTKTAYEFLSQMAFFFGGGIATLLLEELMIYVFITRLQFPNLPEKIVAQVVVIILNYVISKILVLKKV